MFHYIYLFSAPHARALLFPLIHGNDDDGSVVVGLVLVDSCLV